MASVAGTREAGNNVTWILVSAIILMMGVSNKALQCYECLFTDDCKDPFLADGISIVGGVTCTYCVKYKGMDPNDVNVNEDEEVARICETASDISEGCQPHTEDGASGGICYCRTDLCNQSNQVTPLILLSGALSTILVFL